jgi:hypothetical protein
MSAATGHQRNEAQALNALAQFLRERGRDDEADRFDARVYELVSPSAARIA